MANVLNGVERNIVENFNRLIKDARTLQTHRRQTDDRRTDDHSMHCERSVSGEKAAPRSNLFL